MNINKEISDTTVELRYCTVYVQYVLYVIIAGQKAIKLVRVHYLLKRLDPGINFNLL